MTIEPTEIRATYSWHQDDYPAFVQAKALAIPPDDLKSSIPPAAKPMDSAWVIFGPAFISVAIVIGANLLPEPGPILAVLGQNKGTLFFIVTIAAWISLSVNRIRAARRAVKIQKAVFLNLTDIEYDVRFWAEGFSFRCANQTCTHYWQQRAVNAKVIDGYLLLYAFGVTFALREQVLSCTPEVAQRLILGWAKADTNEADT